MKKSLLFATAVFLLSVNTARSQEWDFKTLTKPEQNPVLKADSSFTFTDPVKKTKIKWQKADVFNPAAIVRDNKICLLYRSEDNPAAILGGRTSRIGLATSTDGINFTKYPEPVLYPDNSEFSKWDYPGGCEDPRIVQTSDGLYVLAYTSWNQKVARLSIAVSRDLIHWEKKGPAFSKAYDGKFLNIWSKSGSIVTKMEGDKIVAAKINGRYCMYWGEQFVNVAWSDNLSDWYPSVDDKGNLQKAISPRNLKFDSMLTECGPPAIMTKEGIILFYNGKNADNEKADPNLPKGTYSVGRAIFDPKDPSKVITRDDTCILKPTLPHEMTGQYKSGTTFSEGLVFYKGKWFMYYGTADSFVGVAVSK